MKAMKLSNSDISIITVDNSLEALQKVIGEKIETIGLSDDGVMIVDEEAVLKWKPRNDLASYISGRHVYGDALIVGSDGDEFDDVPEQYFVWLGK